LDDSLPAALLRMEMETVQMADGLQELEVDDDGYYAFVD
jgi:hypothetical protein